MPDKEKENEQQSKWKTFADNVDKKTKKHFEQKKAAGTSTQEEECEGIEFPSRKQLEDQLTQMETKLQEYQEKFTRTRADMENLQRRTELEVTNARKFGAERLVTDLLPVADSLLRGLEGIPQDGADPQVVSIREGLQLTLDLLHRTLQKNGVETIASDIGDVFNPELHEAMSVQESKDAKPNTILQVLQPGYQLNGRVLRAAMVIVAK